jgi:AcrR family transcriptional regulator
MVEEASQLYAAGGGARISFASVAERTGLTKATMFHYFPNKEALLRAVFDSFGERLGRAAENWFDPPPHTHAARLERLIESLVAFYGRDPLNARILCHGLLEADRRAPWSASGGELPPVFAHFVRRFVAFVTSGIAAGEFHPERPMATIMAIGGIVLFEFMLPDQGRQYRASVSLTQRGREMAAIINRAVVRPAVRLRRRGRSARE